MKKYVSLLELYSQTGVGGKIADTLFMKFKNAPSSRRPYNSPSAVGIHSGIFSISENSEENGMGTQFMRTENSVSDVFNAQLFIDCEIPYFLEMEFLKQRLPVSEEQEIPWFTPKELNLLEQMFILSLIIYINSTGDTRAAHENDVSTNVEATDTILAENLIMPILESENLVHEISEDVPDTQAGSVSETMKSIYMKCLGVSGDSIKPKEKPLLLEKALDRMDLAACLFSYTERQFYCDFQLFAPWVLTFLLLEHEMGKLDKLKYDDYKNYMMTFNRYEGNRSMLHRVLQNHIETDNFSYGMRRYMPDGSNDVVFYSKVNEYVKNKMVESVSKNVSTISITQKKDLTEWSYGKINIRLDSPKLCWEEAENNG